jgi:hypothetical protein
VWGHLIDSSFLKEHAARCRSLAEKAGEFTKRRLLDLAARYDGELIRPSRASHIITTPFNLASPVHHKLPWWETHHEIVRSTMGSLDARSVRVCDHCLHRDAA